MKKLTALILAFVMALTFAACSNGDNPDSTTVPNTTTTEPDSTTTEPDTTTSAPDTTSDSDTGLVSDPTSGSDTTPSEPTTEPAETQEGSLEDMLAQIYETVDVDDETRTWLNGMTTTEITAENSSYYFGIENLEFEEAIASEPAMSSIAYSLCLLRVSEGTDIEQLKTDIKENVNPAKWVCVSVEDENVIVDNIGDVVILIMHNEYAEALHNAFLSLE